jgi:hydrogenase expression/formation protein HypE
MLSVCGTVNDLCMQGAVPLYLTLGLILEEGFPLEWLDKIIASMAETLKSCNVKIIAGDTKVIERRTGESIYINTTGIGIMRPDVDVHVGNAKPGDVIIVNGTLGDHGIAVLSHREGLQFSSDIISDVAPLNTLVDVLLNAVPCISCLRDPTRGGLAAALSDIAEQSAQGIVINENNIPVREDVRSACDLLGLDPLQVANEGKVVVVCAPQYAQQILKLIKSHPLGRNASIIGEIVSEHRGQVVLSTRTGGKRPVDLPSGEDLPRIC